MRCHNCGSDKTESDASSGTSYCINCGTVLEENTIVAEVTFGETSGGKAVLQGSYAGESGRISGGGLFGRNRGREGQEQAIENGRVKISSLAHAVRLPERYRDAAQRYYNLAVVNRFTRGRRSDHVAAVCLYAVCRTEKSSHMLIDFSDILQVNVFTLGATFLKLCRILNLTLPHVDPSLYISRFAVALDFGDYTQRVAQDAVRIAQRMDRDWITSGRRPAGICGACLLIAARMNGFRRTTREMIYVVKVADVTIQKRLQEFNQTESAQLSVRDFRTVWLENRADPPSFQKNRYILTIKEKEESESVESANSENEFEDSEEEDEEMTASRKRKGKGPADERPSKRRTTSKSRKRKGKQRSIANDEDEKEEDELSESENEDVDMEEEDDPLKVTDEEVNGPFAGHQKGISEADNSGVSNKKAAESSQPNGTAESSQPNGKKKSERETEEALIIKQIEATLNEEIKHVAEVDVSLTAEATIKSKSNNNTPLDDEDTQVDTQVIVLEESTFIDEVGESTLVEEQGSTLVDEEGNPDYIPIKNAYYEDLAVEEKIRLTSLAKQKIAREENELLNPDLQKDAQEICDDLESWLHDDSVMQAAQEIEKQKHGYVDGEEEEEEEEESDGSLSDVDDDEIAAMILNEDEVSLKTKIWYNANKQYLEEMAIRRMVEKDKGGSSRRGKGYKKKKMPPPTSAAEAAKQMVVNKKLSKKINQAVFDDMFESAESIAKIKQRDAISRINGTSAAPLAAIPEYEVVEEPGDIPDTNTLTKKTGEGSTEKNEKVAENPAAPEEEEDDEDMDSDDMADDERLLRDARAKYALDDEAPEYYSDNNDDDWG